MKYPNEETAARRGMTVRRDLRNPTEWKLDITTNGGSWFWSLHASNVSLQENHNGDRFYALVSQHPGDVGTGLAVWGGEGEFNDAQTAVDHAVGLAMDYAADLMVAVVQGRKAACGWPA